MAITALPLLLLPQLIMGGFIKLYGLLIEHGQQQIVSDIMPVRWAFECLIRAEYDATQASNEAIRKLEGVIGFSGSTEQALLVLCAFIVAFFLSTLSVLRIRCR